MQIEQLKASDLQRIGLSKPYAHQLVSGRGRPSLQMAQKIEAELGIPASVWPLPRKAARIGRPPLAANDSQPQERAA